MTKQILFFFILQCVFFISAPQAKVLNQSHALPNLGSSSLSQAQLIGPIEPQKEITFTLWLNLRNKAQLDTLVQSLYDPNSAQYQKFLTPENYAAQYAPSKEAIQAVQSYFAAHGMRSEQAYANINVTGTAQQIEQLFHVQMNNYRYHKRIVYGTTSSVIIPGDIASYVSGISGLTNIPYTHHNRRHQKPVNSNWQSEVLNIVWKSFMPKATPTTTSFNGFTGAQLRQAYNLANVASINGTTIDGTGQTIVIIDGCGNNTATQIMDYANHYNQVNNLPLLTAGNFTVVKKDGSPYDNVCPNPSGWDGEITLDVEASHTIAPGANIVLVLTNDVDNGDVATALQTIYNNHFTIGGFSNAYVVSNSWDNDFDNQNEPLDATLQSAAAMGMSINFAAGDCGDQTYNSSWPCTKYGNNPSIQYPVSSTYVTAVSGTSLFVDNNWNYSFESGWGTMVNGAFYSGSMGGISLYRSFPTWQSPISNFTAAGYPSGTVGQYNHRAIPDIAMLADLYTGLLTYSGGCNPCYDGGASLATPLFSGTVTLVNQARSVLAGGANPIGLVAPYLYQDNQQLLLASAINLITPPHQIISGAQPAPGGPLSAFQIYDSAFGQTVTFNWDSSLTIIENQFWNDVVGVGSPNIPNFVGTMARI